MFTLKLKLRHILYKIIIDNFFKNIQETRKKKYISKFYTKNNILQVMANVYLTCIRYIVTITYSAVLFNIGTHRKRFIIEVD